jgi:hypothetical protein
MIFAAASEICALETTIISTGKHATLAHKGPKSKAARALQECLLTRSGMRIKNFSMVDSTDCARPHDP